MRNGAISTVLASLLCVGALALGACGGDESNRRDISWHPDDRLPGHTRHWWWEATERACEEDSDCRSDERCQLMRLGTCPTCPRGEDHEICVPRSSGGANARR